VHRALRDDHGIPTAGAEGRSQDGLGTTIAVCRGGVEERHPEIESPMDRGDRRIVVDAAVVAGVLGAADRPHAETEQRHVYSGCSEWSVLHVVPPLGDSATL